MGIFKTYYETHSLIFLLAGLVSILISVLFHLDLKQKRSTFFLLLASSLMFLFAITLDPFLNLWDERFHALVAKNFLQHPFLPTLYDNPIVSMEYDKWDRYHIWFHKQPLFLWQIAISFKLFGISEFTLRIPNVIMGTILTFVIYRSGLRLVNERVGLIAGILFCTSNYILELTSGRLSLDHNDFSFLFYISLSLWTFIEYISSKNKKWIYAIGIFSGLAILCKWLVGLLVYFGWFIYQLQKNKISIRENTYLFLAISITVIIASPWQLYEFICFPIEALKEYSFYADHFTMPLDGHTGPWYYHFLILPKIYSIMGVICLIPALVYFHYKIKNKALFWSLISNIAIVYLFFSLAQTRMPTFTTVVFLILIIILSSFYTYIIEKVSPSKPIINKIFFTLILSIIVGLNLDIEKIQAHHTDWKNIYPDRQKLIENKRIFQNLTLKPNSVLFNIKGRHYIECMFYTGQPCYNFIPSKNQYKEIKELNSQIVIFNSSLEDLPEYLKSDDSIQVESDRIDGYQ